MASEEFRRNSLNSDGSLDWEDVERKVSIISRKFSHTIDWKYLEDLEQELRLFAWTTSSNYWDMYRKAVDYWRMLTRRVFPEICIFEFDDNNGQAGITVDEYLREESFNDVLAKIRASVEDFQNTAKEQRDRENCLRILDLLEKIISGEFDGDPKYTNGKIQFNWVSETLEIPYNRVQDAFWLLQRVCETLSYLGRIELSFLKDFCKEPYKAF